MPVRPPLRPLRSDGLAIGWTTARRDSRGNLTKPARSVCATRILLFSDKTSDRRRAWPALASSVLLALLCGTAGVAAQLQSTNSAASAAKAAPQSPDTGLPVSFERHTGDLDAMVKRGTIRALVLYSRSGFFYVDGRPEGIYYEALRAFERFVNQQLHTRKHIQVTFIPMRPDQIEAALTQGVGDLIAYGLVVTPEREQ